MKYTYYLFLLFGVLFFTSCSKSDLAEEEEVNIETNLRSDNDCRQCDDIIITAKSTIAKDGCCAIILTATLNGECGSFGRQAVFVDGKHFNQFSVNQQEITIEKCDLLPHTIKVYGFNVADGAWSDLCFETTLNCSCSCEDAPFSIQELGRTDFTNCCLYNIIAGGTQSITPTSEILSPNCNFNLAVNDEYYRLSNSEISSIPVEICEDTQVQLLRNGMVCKDVVLSCNCCEGLTIEHEQLDTDENGCCIYNVSMTNHTACAQSLFNNHNESILSLKSGQSNSVITRVCPEAINAQYQAGSSLDDICQTLNLINMCTGD